MHQLIYMARKRKPVAYRLDELVLDVLSKLAREENSSVNRYIEKHFFIVGKERGLIPDNEELLGETRGGSSRDKSENKDKEIDHEK